MNLKNQIINVIFYGILVIYLQYSLVFLFKLLDIYAELPDYCLQYALNTLYYSLLVFVPAGVLLGIAAYLPWLKMKTIDSKFVTVYLVFAYLFWFIVGYFFTFHVIAVAILGFLWVPYPLSSVYSLIPYMIFSVFGWVAWIKLIKAI